MLPDNDELDDEDENEGLRANEEDDQEPCAQTRSGMRTASEPRRPKRSFSNKKRSRMRRRTGTKKTTNRRHVALAYRGAHWTIKPAEIQYSSTAIASIPFE
jgi:hypothetical protein